ncbi:prephenate dehydrogenase [Neorhodopirellula pilleata]|uniref:Prephenate dehydrogenase n=2 Tax=Neorhodopirellula pilleata TaxID=2714738 RepID=A0A5C6A8Z5_9BACT|nr:prephenate dehydrogenase [Neorhodopirellula pilleata]
MRIAVVGLGLLGGSVARAVRDRMPDARVVGCARNEKTRQYAMENGVVDEATAELAAAVRGADLVVVATPVDAIAHAVIEIAAADPNTLITDVGSTKSNIVSAVVADATAASRFIAAHPIAGSEKTGVEHSRADLFVGRPVILTPSGFESTGAVERVADFWCSLGGNVSHMSADAHDQLLAISSHMPHLMASLIAGQLPPEGQAIVGTGWLDTTRIAAGDPQLWTAIVGENRTAIVNSLRSIGRELTSLIDAIETHDDSAVEEMLRSAQTIRLHAVNHESRP